MRTLRNIIASVCLMLPVCGQVGAPLLGYLPDGQSIRPVIGIPAAAAIVDPVRVDAPDGSRSAPLMFSRAAASSTDFVLGSLAGSGSAASFSLANGLSLIQGVGANPASITVSPRGSAAAFWFDNPVHAQTLAGLPQATVRDVAITFATGLPAASAISDDGQWMVGVWASGAYAFGPESRVVNLAASGPIRAVSFISGTHDLLLATDQTLLRIADVGGVQAPASLQNLNAPPLAVASSRDGKLAILAFEDGTVLRSGVDAGSTAGTVNCDCVPEGLYALQSGAFRLTSLAAGSFKLFDAQNGSVWYVPLQSPPTSREERGRRR